MLYKAVLLVPTSPILEMECRRGKLLLWHLLFPRSRTDRDRRWFRWLDVKGAFSIWRKDISLMAWLWRRKEFRASRHVWRRKRPILWKLFTSQHLDGAKYAEQMALSRFARGMIHPVHLASAQDSLLSIRDEWGFQIKDFDNDIVIVAGQLDVNVPIEGPRYLHKHLPKSELVGYPCCDHHLWKNHAVETMDVIRDAFPSFEAISEEMRAKKRASMRQKPRPQSSQAQQDHQVSRPPPLAEARFRMTPEASQPATSRFGPPKERVS
jgi:pimeloyl-ACP methyl ester carboxylesterase